MTALYKLDEEIAALEDKFGEALDASEGELGAFEENLENQPNGLKIERDRKLLGVGCWIKNMDSDIEALKIEEANLNKRRKAVESKSERIKAWLQDNMTEGEKLKDPRCMIGWQKSKGLICNLDNPKEETPSEFIEEIISLTSTIYEYGITESIGFLLVNQRSFTNKITV